MNLGINNNHYLFLVLFKSQQRAQHGKKPKTETTMASRQMLSPAIRDNSGSQE